MTSSAAAQSFATASVRATPIGRPAPAVPAVRLLALTKRFRARRTIADVLRRTPAAGWTTSVDAVTFDVADGEFFGLLGPNGAGKSTLFQVLSTLLLADDGEAAVHGHDVAAEADVVRRLVAPVLPDERSLSWRLDAIGNLQLFAGLHGLRRAEAARRIGEVLTAVDLQDTGSRLVGQFSSGMRQRLLIARALLARPRVLLLDEPTRSLDPIAARAFRAFLRDEVVGRQGCTVLLATHAADEALGLCDRVAVLHKGRLLAVGTAAALAHDVAGRRLVVWTTMAQHPAFAALEAMGLARRTGEDAADGAWRAVVLEVGESRDAQAEALRELVRRGVDVCRFEESPLPLADLLECVMARGTP